MSSKFMLDEFWMERALLAARKAAERGEVPVGAVLVQTDGTWLSSAGNVRETRQTPLGHAEIVALARGARRIHSWRLTDMTLYVTLEPCLMCLGAILQARLGRLVYGASDPKAGAFRGELINEYQLTPYRRIEVVPGVLAGPASELLKTFFRDRR